VGESGVSGASGLIGPSGVFMAGAFGASGVLTLGALGDSGAVGASAVLPPIVGAGSVTDGKGPGDGLIVTGVGLPVGVYTPGPGSEKSGMFPHCGFGPAVGTGGAVGPGDQLGWDGIPGLAMVGGPGTDGADAPFSK